jgi:hypothetical protein
VSPKNVVVAGRVSSDAGGVLVEEDDGAWAAGDFDTPDVFERPD